MNNMKLPVGIDQFDKLIKSGFYYVDKTRLIEQLLQNWGEVNLFTRPRRFGKTLNMSMLKSFFEIGTDKTLFDQLYIAANKELCEEYMGQYPVIFLSLKGVDGLNFEEAKSMLKITIRTEAQRPKKEKKCMTVTKSGKVTLKKKAKKGTYKIRITAAKTSKYQKAVKYVTVKVK